MNLCRYIWCPHSDDKTTDLSDDTSSDDITSSHDTHHQVTAHRQVTFSLLNLFFISGQWIRFSCTALQPEEFHSFTLTSAPHEVKRIGLTNPGKDLRFS